MKDMFGTVIEVGDIVLKPTTRGRSAFIEKRVVTKIDGDNIYLDDSKVTIWYPERLVVFA